MRRWIAVVVLLGCSEEGEKTPPPLGPSSGSSPIGSAGASTAGDTEGSSDASSSSGSTSGGDTDVETGSETPCGNWAEVYLGCIDTTATLPALEMQCDAELADWEDPLPSCRVLAEELLVCVTQLPCQAFADWELDSAVPPECAAQSDALTQMCSFVGTTTF